jgi:hypothetical protein
MFWLPEIYESPFPLNYDSFSLLKVNKSPNGSLRTISFLMNIVRYAASRTLIINVYFHCTDLCHIAITESSLLYD